MILIKLKFNKDNYKVKYYTHKKFTILYQKFSFSLLFLF